jgi:hypothetical protein
MFLSGYCPAIQKVWIATSPSQRGGKSEERGKHNTKVYADDAGGRAPEKVVV